jgi:hypothetical protein
MPLRKKVRQRHAINLEIPGGGLFMAGARAGNSQKYDSRPLAHISTSGTTMVVPELFCLNKKIHSCMFVSFPSPLPFIEGHHES